MIQVAIICGLGVAVGVAMVIGALMGWSLVAKLTGRVKAAAHQLGLRGALALGSGLIAFVATGWPVAAGLAAVFGCVAPSLLSGRNSAQNEIARTEAIANWTEMLRDTMAGAAGLQSAIDASAKAAPIAIRVEVEALAVRLKRRSFEQSLRVFADDVSHPTADLVVASLLLASNRQAKNVGTMLGALADAARADATMRLRVEAGRARTRTSVRVVVGFTLAMAVGLIILNRTYLQPYDSAVGQLVLGGVGLSFMGAFVWMNKISNIAQPPRLLQSPGISA